MEKIRKGNDTKILWEIMQGNADSGIPYNLAGKNLSFYIKSFYKMEKVENFTVKGNVLQWTFAGKDQVYSGEYTLTLIENEGEEGMHTVDECKAFELVDCSCMEGGEAESHVRIETIRLKSGISVNSIVPDKKLDVDSGNVVENAAVAKEFQRVDKDIKRVSDTVENQGREIVNLGETLSEHGDALDVLNGEGEGSVKKTVADEVARIVADAPEGYDTLKEIADYIASDKTGAAQINNTLDAHGKAISAIEKKNTEQDTAIGKKAEQDGVYPDMTVGLAEDLGGRPYYDDAEFSFRASAGSDTSIKDGMASIKELRGNSVVWNQSAKAFKDADMLPYVTDSSITYDGQDVTIENWEAFTPFRFNAHLSQHNGHKYIILMDYKNDNPSQKLYIQISSAQEFGFLSSSIALFVTIDIVNQSNAYKDYVSIFLSDNSAGIIRLSNLQIIDLTLMFGAGNEPTTIEEYYARKPIVTDEYAYNEGEVIHMAADGIKSVGDNAFNKDKAIRGDADADGIFTPNAATNIFAYLTRCLPNEVYYFYDALNGFLNYTCYFYDASMQLAKADIVYQGDKENAAYGEITSPDNAFYMRIACHQDYLDSCFVTLVHSGWKQDTDAKYQPYWDDTLLIDQRIKDAFPEGLRKWDKVYNKNGKGYIVKGTGVADMGNLEYISARTGEFYIPILSDMADTNDSLQVGGIITSRYATISSSEADSFNRDQCIYMLKGYMYIRDSSYTDVASFKAAMAGVPLYYELATPEVIEYDEPFNLDYRVADFGTEEVISDQPSAPIAAEIQYNFNANDTIRTNRIAIRDMHREIAELRAMISAMQVQLINKEDEA